MKWRCAPTTRAKLATTRPPLFERLDKMKC